ncbi:MAG: aldolase [Sphingobium sp.]|jgi:serine kinase of HPr protein (carbohydrate metabolism regulator)|nr:MAG: aldolase [Sphingobium sp.]
MPPAASIHTDIESPIETLHATTVAIGGRAVMLHGPSGVGKSDLALRLIDRGATLVSDDYTVVRREGDRAIASPPPTIAGRIEVRGVGIIALPHLENAPVALLLDLDGEVERMPPEPLTRPVAGVEVPIMTIAPREPSAPIKVEMALRAHGLVR